MSTLNAVRENFRRIPESRYQAEIAAAEERGRAMATSTPGSTAVLNPTPMPAAANHRPSITKEEGEAAMAQIKAMQAEAASSETYVDRRAGVQTAEAEAVRRGRVFVAAQDVGTDNDPHAMVRKIDAQIAKAKSEGRRIGSIQALSELKQMEASDEVSKGVRMIDAQIAKAKSEGRTIGAAKAAFEIRRNARLSA